MGLGFLAMAFVLAGGVAAMLAGQSLDNQLDVFEWTNDVSSLNSTIQEEFASKRTQSMMLTWGGVVFQIVGAVFMLKLYRYVRPR